MKEMKTKETRTEETKKYEELEFGQKVLALQVFNELLQNEQQKALQATQAYNSGYHFWRHVSNFFD